MRLGFTHLRLILLGDELDADDLSYALHLRGTHTRRLIGDRFDDSASRTPELQRGRRGRPEAEQLPLQHREATFEVDQLNVQANPLYGTFSVRVLFTLPPFGAFQSPRCTRRLSVAYAINFSCVAIGRLNLICFFARPYPRLFRVVNSRMTYCSLPSEARFPFSSLFLMELAYWTGRSYFLTMQQ